MLSEALTEELVAVGLSAAGKKEVISELLDILCRTGKVKDRGQALRDVLENESRMSTGLEQGVAAPHAKTKAVDEFVACVAVTRTAIDFQSLDGRPAQIFIMTLSPKGHSGPHVQFLAEISRALKEKRTRKRVLGSRSPAELLAALVTE